MAKGQPIPDPSTLPDVLAEFVQKAMSAAEQGGEFLSGQLPEYVQQLLLWKAAEAGVWAAIGLLVIVAFWYANTKVREWGNAHLQVRRDYGLDRSDLAIIRGLFLLIGHALGGSVFVGNGVIMLQIWLAPKVWLVEYVARLL